MRLILLLLLTVENLNSSVFVGSLINYSSISVRLRAIVLNEAHLPQHWWLKLLAVKSQDLKCEIVVHISKCLYCQSYSMIFAGPWPVLLTMRKEIRVDCGDRSEGYIFSVRHFYNHVHLSDFSVLLSGRLCHRSDRSTLILLVISSSIMSGKKPSMYCTLLNYLEGYTALWCK